MAGAIWLINSLLDGKNELIPNIKQEFADNFTKIIIHEISPKSFSQDFVLVLKLSKN